MLLYQQGRHQGAGGLFCSTLEQNKIKVAGSKFTRQGGNGKASDWETPSWTYNCLLYQRVEEGKLKCARKWDLGSVFHMPYPWHGEPLTVSFPRSHLASVFNTIVQLSSSQTFSLSLSRAFGVDILHLAYTDYTLYILYKSFQQCNVHSLFPCLLWMCMS